MQTLWGETRKSRKRRRSRKLPTAAAYSITENDCEVIGHTLNTYDLAGCTTCMDCGARIFCPQCLPQHPTDGSAVAVLCPRYEERKKAVQFSDNFIPVIPVDFVEHTSEMPFCFANPACPCHDDHEEIQKVAVWVMEGLMTEEEAINFIAGRTF